MYGWRARIGHLYPSGGITGEFELQRMAPEGVVFLTTRLNFPKADLEHDTQIAEYVEDAARLVAHARVDLIAFNCTVGSLIRGIGYDQEISRRIHRVTGIPSTTTVTAVVEALQQLKVRKLVLITPYLREITDIEAAFLEENGFQVLATHAEGKDHPYDQAAIPPSHWYRVARSMRHLEADAYFISCAGIEVVEIIQAIEHDLLRPVVTSNQALLWHCLKLVGVHQPIRGFGTLLEGL